jgi:phenylpyruvate tautomerase PptA (4-oxalocrotonate tautomerase family)
MPHISIKMLKGRTKEQKERAAEAAMKAIMEALNIGETYITVSVEDYTAKEWQKVFKEEITDKQDKIFIKPKYDPKMLI